MNNNDGIHEHREEFARLCDLFENLLVEYSEHLVKGNTEEVLKKAKEVASSGSAIFSSRYLTNLRTLVSIFDKVNSMSSRQ